MNQFWLGKGQGVVLVNGNCRCLFSEKVKCVITYKNNDIQMN
jgi:hypothetical protein